MSNGTQSTTIIKKNQKREGGKTWGNITDRGVDNIIEEGQGEQEEAVMTGQEGKNLGQTSSSKME